MVIEVRTPLFAGLSGRLAAGASIRMLAHNTYKGDRKPRQKKKFNIL
jgi:hypothetical protein